MGCFMQPSPWCFLFCTHSDTHHSLEIRAPLDRSELQSHARLSATPPFPSSVGLVAFGLLPNPTTPICTTSSPNPWRGWPWRHGVSLQRVALAGARPATLEPRSRFDPEGLGANPTSTPGGGGPVKDTNSRAVFVDHEQLQSPHKVSRQGLPTSSVVGVPLSHPLTGWDEPNHPTPCDSWPNSLLALLETGFSFRFASATPTPTRPNAARQPRHDGWSS